MTELPDGFIDGENVSYDPGTAGDEGDVVEATEIVQPTQYDQGTIEPPADPETVEAFHVYTRDVTDTDLTYVQGAPIDTEAIRKWIVDKGYPVIAVDAELDADGASTTGIVSIRTPIVAPDIVVALSRADVVTNNSTTTLTTYIAATAIAGVTGHTYSGTLTYGAEFWSTDPVGMVRVRPMVNGTQQTVDDLSVGDSIQQLTFPIDVVALPATGTLGLTFRNFTSGATASIQNGFITGTLTSDQPKGEEIPEVEWADYAGVRDQAIVETVVAWDDTAEGATVPVPDQDRIIALQMHIERNGYEVQQITGEWNFTTPDTAPATPELHVYARGAVDSAVTDAFLYSEIQQVDRDAFRMDWNAAVPQSVLRRKAQGQVEALGQEDRSSPVLFPYTGPGIEPTGDVREGDYWNSAASEWRQYINGEWIVVATGTFSATVNTTATGRRGTATGGNSTATGTFADATTGGTATGTSAKASGSFSTATGAFSQSKSGFSTATGYGAIVQTGSSRSIAEGYGAVVPTDTPDTKVTKVNNVIQERSNGTGATTYTLKSPDGTNGIIAVTDTDEISVNGTTMAKSTHTHAHSALTGIDTDTATTAIHHTLGPGASQAAAGNHTHAQLHDALTTTDSAEIDFTLTGQDLTASLKTGSIGPTKLNQPYQGVIPFASGKYYSTVESAYGMSGAYGTFAVNANRTYYLPFWVPSTTTFDQIGINVQTAVAASNARLGIFTFDQSLTTATLVLDAGAVSTAATGSVFATISHQLTAGWWWLAVNCSHTPSLRSFTPADGFACNSTGTITAARIKATDTYGAYSATETADADGGTGILILMRAA